jgi:hypothetical protein
MRETFQTPSDLSDFVFAHETNHGDLAHPRQFILRWRQRDGVRRKFAPNEKRRGSASPAPFSVYGTRAERKFMQICGRILPGTDLR